MKKREQMQDRKKIVKRLFTEYGMSVLIKDIETVQRHGFLMRSQDGGTFEHREIYLVILKTGERFEILRETVDTEGNFSTGSAYFVTKSIREVK